MGNNPGNLLYISKYIKSLYDNEHLTNLQFNLEGN